MRLAAGLPTLTQPLPGTGGVTATVTASPARPAVLATATGTIPVTVRGHPGHAVEWSERRRRARSPRWCGRRAPSSGSSCGRPPGCRWTAWPGSPRASCPSRSPRRRRRTFALVPDGYTIDNVSPAAVTFCPADVAFDQSFVGKITVMLGVTGEQSPGRRVDVACDTRAR